MLDAIKTLEKTEPKNPVKGAGNVRVYVTSAVGDLIRWATGCPGFRDMMDGKHFCRVFARRIGRYGKANGADADYISPEMDRLLAKNEPMVLRLSEALAAYKSGLGIFGKP